MSGLLIALALAFSTLTAAADGQDAKFAALPQGVPVIAPGALEKSRAQGEFGQAEPVAVQGHDFAQAVRIRTEKRPAQPYRFQVRVPTVAAVKTGDKLLAVFEARAVEPQGKDGTAETELVFEQAGEPYTKTVSHHVEFGTSWQRFYVPFEVKLDHDAGKAAVIFRAGYDPQTIEIGGVRVLDFGAEFPLANLPLTPRSYVGRDADAPWRKTAAERIERLRKANLTVTDAAGKPLPGVKVRAQMKRHAFGWGSAVDARTLLGDGPDSERYRQIVTENFNKAVLENDMKWVRGARTVSVRSTPSRGCARGHAVRGLAKLRRLSAPASEATRGIFWAGQTFDNSPHGNLRGALFIEEPVKDGAAVRFTPAPCSTMLLTITP